MAPILKLLHKIIVYPVSLVLLSSSPQYFAKPPHYSAFHDNSLGVASFFGHCRQPIVEQVVKAQGGKISFSVTFYVKMKAVFRGALCPNNESQKRSLSVNNDLPIPLKYNYSLHR